MLTSLNHNDIDKCSLSIEYWHISFCNLPKQCNNSYHYVLSKILEDLKTCWLRLLAFVILRYKNCILLSLMEACKTDMRTV